MDDSTAHDMGRVIGYLVWWLPLFYFVKQGIHEEARWRRQANLAVACGLSFVVLQPLTSLFGTSSSTVLFGCLWVLMGATGIALGVASLRNREADALIGRTRPVVGIVLCALGVFAGLGASLLPVLIKTRADPSSAWTYTDPTHGFQVKLPSGEWRQTQDAKGRTAFVRAMPRMQLQVTSVKTGQTEADYEAAVRGVKRVFDDGARDCKETAKHRAGTTPSGNPFAYSTCTDKAFAATSVIFSRSKGLVLLTVFEGQSKMFSMTGQAAENEAFEATASAILQSVE